MNRDKCAHCDHYQTVASQLFDTAIELDEAEGRIIRLQERLRTAIDALVWLMGQRADSPAWVKQAVEDAETSV